MGVLPPVARVPPPGTGSAYVRDPWTVHRPQCKIESRLGGPGDVRERRRTVGRTGPTIAGGRSSYSCTTSSKMVSSDANMSLGIDAVNRIRIIDSFLQTNGSRFAEYKRTVHASWASSSQAGSSRLTGPNRRPIRADDARSLARVASHFVHVIRIYD